MDVEIKLSEEEIRLLIREALEARRSSYCPYSGFAVGAALLTKGGKIFKGCNIENAGYSSTVCAERTAVFKAVSEGEREFAAIAIAGGPKGSEPEVAGGIVPCGVCRQVLLEFGMQMTVIGANSEEEYSVYTLKELMPFAFGPENLSKEGKEER